MDSFDKTLQNISFGLRYLFSADNPFVPWMLIIDLLLIAAHLWIVYWVYRDALARYNRGAPWAVAAAVLPVAGWLFYLLYRKSALVEFDRIEAEIFDESEHEWTDYDAYRAGQQHKLFTEITALWRKPEAEGYSPWVRLSRMRELQRALTPEEKLARRAQRKAALATRRKTHAEKQALKQERRRERARQTRERTTLATAHGFTSRMSDRGQKRFKRKLEVMEKLKTVAREDPLLEDLIYEMDYAGALNAARDSLAIAEELGDAQGVVTYKAYIERLEGLVGPASDS